MTTTVAAIYDIHANLPALEAVLLRHTAYDLAYAAARVRDTRYPQADDFAERNVLKPPTEQEILEAFARVELK